MRINQAFREAWPEISKFPDDTYINECCFVDGKILIRIICNDLEEFARIRKRRLGVIWKRVWDSDPRIFVGGLIRQSSQII